MSKRGARRGHEDPNSERQVKIRELRAEADRLYMEWRGGALKEIVEEIEQTLQEGYTDVECARIAAKINEIKMMHFEKFVEYKRERDQTDFDISKIKGTRKMELFPPRSSRSSVPHWLHHAKKVAMKVEQFISHTARKNPNPPESRQDETTGKPDREYKKDHRHNRTEHEQMWLTVEDELSKLTNRKKRAKHGGRKAVPEPDMPPPNERAFAGRPYQTAKRLSSSAAYPPAARRAPPRSTSRRLPAFPAYPTY